MPFAAHPPIIQLEHVSLAFRPHIGVFDLTFRAAKGTILGLIGPSGCGKTTTIRLMTGLLRPTRGQISVLGKTPVHFTAADQEQIGYIPQHFVLYPSLTVTENLHFVSSLYGMTPGQRRQRLETLLDFTELAEAQGQLASKLSGGMQRRLMLAGALMHNPQLLFADEPTAGIDPVLRHRFWNYFRELRNQGRTLLVTTQYVAEAVYCDYVAVMRAGRVLMVDTPAVLRRTAMGGEILLLVVEADRAWEVIELLKKYPGVKSVDPKKGHHEQIHVLVDDAGEMLPPILRTLQESLAVTVYKAEPYLPPFDDVFVKLMERAEQEDVRKN